MYSPSVPAAVQFAPNEFCFTVPSSLNILALIDVYFKPWCSLSTIKVGLNWVAGFLPVSWDGPATSVASFETLIA